MHPLLVIIILILALQVMMFGYLVWMAWVWRDKTRKWHHHTPKLSYLGIGAGLAAFTIVWLLMTVLR